jgi:streptogramin lyase
MQSAIASNGVLQWSFPQPHGIGWGLGAVWVSGHHSKSVARIDPATNQMSAELAGASSQAQDVLVAFGSLWVPATGGPMARMDPTTGAVIASLQPPDGQYADAEAGFGAVWVVSTSNLLDRIDPETDSVTLSVEVGEGTTDHNNTVAIGNEFVWVAVPDDGELLAFDPVSGEVRATLHLNGPSVVAAGAAGVWAAMENGTLYRADEAQRGIGQTIQTDSTGYNLVETGSDSVWFAGADATLRQFDVVTGAEAGSYPLHGPPEGLLIAEGSAWVEYYDAGLVERIDLERVVP